LSFLGFAGFHFPEINSFNKKPPWQGMIAMDGLGRTWARGGHEITTRNRLDGGAVAPRRLRPQGPGRLGFYVPIYFGRVAATRPLEDATQSGQSKGRNHQQVQHEARFDLYCLLPQVNPVVGRIFDPSHPPLGSYLPTNLPHQPVDIIASRRGPRCWSAP